jgi:hypothetical protein
LPPQEQARLIKELLQRKEKSNSSFTIRPNDMQSPDYINNLFDTMLYNAAKNSGIQSA